MARVHGKDADFSFDSVALEDELNNITANFEVPEAEITAFADAWQNFLAGKPTVSYDVAGSWDGAAGAGDITIFNELGLEGEEIDFEPDGTTGYNGFAIVTSYSINAPVNGPVTYTANFRHNGGSAAADGAAPTRA
jgi:predicted secreted protein